MCLPDVASLAVTGFHAHIYCVTISLSIYIYLTPTSRFLTFSAHVFLDSLIFSHPGLRRDLALDKVRAWWRRITNHSEPMSASEEGSFIGFNGEASDGFHRYDPTIYRYSSSVDPTLGAIFSDGDEANDVMVHNPPPFADRISEVWRQPFCDPSDITCPALEPLSDRNSQDTDTMCVFEGKTGMLVDKLPRYPGFISRMFPNSSP